MSLIRKLASGEARAIDASQFPKGIFTDTRSEAGVSVTQDSAMALVPVYACIRLRSDAVASLPVDVFRKKDADRIPAPHPAWMEKPNPESTWGEFIERSVYSHDADGNIFYGITAYDDLGLPAEFHVLNPTDVQVRKEAGRVLYKVNGTDYPMWERGQRNAQQSIHHIKAFAAPGTLRGLSPIEQAAQGIGLGLAAEKFGARFFGSGQNPSGVIEYPHSWNEDVAEATKKGWFKKHGGVSNSHMPAVLFGGAQWKPITVPNDQAQFLETRKFQVSEIARLFRVPPHLIGDVEKSTSWGTGIEEQTIGFVVYSLTPTLVRLEQAFNQFTPRGQFVKFNVNGLLRGDSKKQAEAFSIGIQNGYLTRNEVRRLLDMNGLPGLDEPLVPNANAIPASQGNPTPDDEN